MAPVSLDRLLRPKSVAVIGGVEAERVVEQLDRLDFEGEVWPVHPTRSALGGRTCVAAVDALPAPPDAAFVAVPREATPRIVRSLAALGSGGAVVYSSGFAESGDGTLQDELVAAAGEMPLLGPNCYGYVNALDGTAVWPDVHGLHPIERGVAIITQSGNIGINLTMARRGLDLGMVITAGNQAALDIPTLVDALLDDERVTAIGVQLEAIRDGRHFGRAAIRAAGLGVPLVALKMGASSLGAAVTSSHTGALAGDDDAYDALFRRYGVARVHTIPSLLEALKLAGRVPPQPRVISLSASGGEASHVADVAHRAGVALPALEAGHITAIRAEVDDLVTVSNPMDYHTFSWGDEARLTSIFRAVVGGPFDVAMLVLDFPATDVPPAWWTACRAFAAAAQDLTGLVVSSLPENLPDHAQAQIRKLGLIPMMGIAETIDALASLVPPSNGFATELHLAGRAMAGALRSLDEAAAKAILAAAGVPVPSGIATQDPQAAPVPFPRTVKVLGIDHKAEVGAVAVGVADEAELARVVARMPPGNGFLVEETIEGGVAELLVSIRAVPDLGWMLTVGAGGGLVDVFDDHAHLLVAAERTEIEAALDSLRIGPSLRRLWDSGRADLGAVLDAVSALQSLPGREAGLVEAEINPLIVTATGVVAVDALVSVT